MQVQPICIECTANVFERQIPRISFGDQHLNLSLACKQKSEMYKAIISTTITPVRINTSFSTYLLIFFVNQVQFDNIKKLRNFASTMNIATASIVWSFVTTTLFSFTQQEFDVLDPPPKITLVTFNQTLLNMLFIKHHVHICFKTPPAGGILPQRLPIHAILYSKLYFPAQNCLEPKASRARTDGRTEWEQPSEHDTTHFHHHAQGFWYNRSLPSL